MEPCLKQGMEMRLTTKSVHDIKASELVVFLHPLNRRKIIHRLLLNGKTHVICKGDNHYLFDRPVPHHQVLGIATLQPPIGNTSPMPMKNFKNNPFWIGVLKIFGYTLLVVYQFVCRYRHTKEGIGS